MNFRPKRNEEPDVSLTPLIDVVFLLLIFFMVSTSFDRYADLKIDLPKSSVEAQEHQEKETLEIVIDAKGQYFINRQQLINTDISTLKKMLNKTISGNKSLPVVIRADEKSSYQSFITVLDAVGQVGLTNISMPTTQSGKE